MKDKYITITGFKHYYGLKPLTPGTIIRCRKEPSNPHDSEAIRCMLPLVGTVGYIANSPDTVAGGTMSAGRIYDHVGERFHVRVMFTTFTKVICKIERGCFNELDKEVLEQMNNSQWDDDDWSDWDTF